MEIKLNILSTCINLYFIGCFYVHIQLKMHFPAIWRPGKNCSTRWSPWVTKYTKLKKLEYMVEKTVVYKSACMKGLKPISEKKTLQSSKEIRVFP